MAVGDTKYGTIENIVGLERDGLRAYLPTTDFSKRTEFFPPERFQYDPQHDLYHCPQGIDLPLYSRRRREEMLVYRADPKVCNQCPVKAKCTASRSGRHIFRSFFQEYLDRVQAYHDTEAYKKALRKRMVWVEPLFGEAKQWHQRVRFRLRGLRKVNTDYVAYLGGPEKFGSLLWRETQRRQWHQARDHPVLGDGANWIWNLAGSILETVARWSIGIMPNSTCIGPAIWRGAKGLRPKGFARLICDAHAALGW